ncbi:MAG: macro domain-containing protein [Opitutaceae bacterium]
MKTNPIVMIKFLQNADITEVRSDALIYSTNTALTLTGGVGASLLDKHGIKLQIDLHEAVAEEGTRIIEVGDVIRTNFSYMPWQYVFHTIATDESYHTTEATVFSILNQCLRECAKTRSIRTVTTSPLGAGFGDLKVIDFIKICEQALENIDDSILDAFHVVVKDTNEYLTLSKSESVQKNWQHA